MNPWDPAAARDPFPDAGSFIAGPYRVVLHSTEGNSYGGARSAYTANKVSPHFTASYEKGRLELWQHVALSRAATALEHRAGTVHTNRLSAIQIEVVAFAAKPDWPAGLVAGVADLIRWIMEQTGVQAVAPTFKPYPASYGERNGVRFSDKDWLAFNGVCGHQHVPHQVHGDPGAINILALLPGKTAVVRPAGVPGSGPPTVTATQYPQGEDMLTRHDVDIPALDGQGRGWVELAVDPTKVVSIVVNGPYPPSDGYWELPAVARQDRAGKTIITLTEGSPNERIMLSVWVTG